MDLYINAWIFNKGRNGKGVLQMHTLINAYFHDDTFSWSFIFFKKLPYFSTDSNVPRLIFFVEHYSMNSPSRFF